MSEPLTDTWHNRDLPVLREVVRLYDRGIGRVVRVSAIEAALDLDEDDIQRALNALAMDALIDTEGSMQKKYLTVSRVSGEARRKAGAWPTEQTALDRIIAALEAIAENTDDPEEKSKAQKFAAWLRTGATTVGLSVASAAIGGQIPGT
jgi:hypothetical protein